MPNNFWTFQLKASFVHIGIIHIGQCNFYLFNHTLNFIYSKILLVTRFRGLIWLKFNLLILDFFPSDSLFNSASISSPHSMLAEERFCQTSVLIFKYFGIYIFPQFFFFFCLMDLTWCVLSCTKMVVMVKYCEGFLPFFFF